MKNLFKQCCFLLFIVVLMSITGCSSTKRATAPAPSTTPPSPSTNTATNEDYSSLVGTWAFDVKGIPDGDVKGDMIISLNGNALKGMISAGGAQSEIQNFKVTNNLLTGIFYYNGVSVNMSGTFKGNAYEGKVEAEGYAFPMIAAKK